MNDASFEFKAQTGDILWLKAVPEPKRPSHAHATESCRGCVGDGGLCTDVFRGLSIGSHGRCVDDHIIFVAADQATKDKIALIKIKLRLKQ